jgi:hypothetical protein
MLYRTVVVGLLGACLLTLVRHQPQPAKVDLAAVSVAASSPRRAAMPPPATNPPPTLIDVSAVMPTNQLLGLVTLAPGEQIVSFEDHTTYKDLEVRGSHGTRRVLLLMH